MDDAGNDVNTYNMDGRIVQVEYAMKTMNTGSTTLGIRLQDSVIIVSEKKITSNLQLIKNKTNHFKIYDTILAGVSGITGDAPTNIKKCRNICINHEKIYKEQMEIPKIMEEICSLVLRFGEEKFENKIYSRPFGVSILIAAYQYRPILYHIDTSRSNLEYKARSVGSAHEIVENRNYLEDSIHKFNTEKEALQASLEILGSVLKEKLTENNVEVSIVDKNGIRNLEPNEIMSYYLNNFLLIFLIYFICKIT